MMAPPLAGVLQAGSGQPAVQNMSVQVPQGMQGGMPLQVQTPAGVVQVQIPPGLQPGMSFQIQAPGAADFIPSASFSGFRPGYEFKSDAQGVGYYRSTTLNTLQT